MHYLSDGLKELKLKHLGGFTCRFHLCVLCIGGSFGGGNAFQGSSIVGFN